MVPLYLYSLTEQEQLCFSQNSLKFVKSSERRPPLLVHLHAVHTVENGVKIGLGDAGFLGLVNPRNIYAGKLLSVEQGLDNAAVFVYSIRDENVFSFQLAGTPCYLTVENFVLRLSHHRHTDSEFRLAGTKDFITDIESHLQQPEISTESIFSDAENSSPTRLSRQPTEDVDSKNSEVEQQQLIAQLRLENQELKRKFEEYELQYDVLKKKVCEKARVVQELKGQLKQTQTEIYNLKSN